MRVQDHYQWDEIVASNSISPLTDAQLVQYLNYLVLIGGDGETGNIVSRFNLGSKLWSTDKHEFPKNLSNVTGHTVTHLSGSSFAYIIGGRTPDGKAVSDYLTVLDLASGNYSHPMVDSNMIPYNHVTLPVGRQFLVIGGSNPNTAYSPARLIPSLECNNFGYNKLEESRENCGECILTPGCGLCTSGKGTLSCVAGTADGPYLDDVCQNGDYTTDAEHCHVDIKPAPFVIPLSVSSLVPIVVIVVGAIYLDIRKGKQHRAEYTAL